MSNQKHRLRGQPVSESGEFVSQLCGENEVDELPNRVPPWSNRYKHEASTFAPPKLSY